jgi:hypothetical protein
MAQCGTVNFIRLEGLASSGDIRFNGLVAGPVFAVEVFLAYFGLCILCATFWKPVAKRRAMIRINGFGMADAEIQPIFRATPCQ